MVFSTRGKCSGAAIFLLGKEKLKGGSFVFHRLVLPLLSSLTKYVHSSNECCVPVVTGVRHHMPLSIRGRIKK